MSSASHYPLRVTCIKHIKNWYWNIFRLGRFVGNKIPCFLIHKLTVVKSTVLFGRSLLTFKPSLDGRLRSWWTSCPQPSSWLGISPAVEISSQAIDELAENKLIDREFGVKQCSLGQTRSFFLMKKERSWCCPPAASRAFRWEGDRRGGEDSPWRDLLIINAIFTKGNFVPKLCNRRSNFPSNFL